MDINNFAYESIRTIDHPLEIIFFSYSMNKEIIVNWLNPYAHLSTNKYDLPQIKSDTFRGPLHRHDFYELMYVEEGTICQIIESKRHLYPKGSLCFLNRNIHHLEEYPDDVRTVFLEIQPSLLNDILFKDDRFFDTEKNVTFFATQDINDFNHGLKYMDFIPIRSSSDEPHEIISEICRHFIDPGPGSTYAIKMLLFRLYAILQDPSQYTTVPVSIGTDKENAIFKQIDALIKENNGRISRKDISIKINYSGSYIDKVVKKYTGSSLTEYSNSICMKVASDMLCKSNATVAQIAENLHFTNMTHFFTMFKKEFGVTPSQYRKKEYFEQ